MDRNYKTAKELDRKEQEKLARIKAINQILIDGINRELLDFRPELPQVQIELKYASDVTNLPVYVIREYIPGEDRTSKYPIGQITDLNHLAGYLQNLVQDNQETEERFVAKGESGGSKDIPLSTW